jgi:hypothetical protein
MLIEGMVVAGKWRTFVLWVLAFLVQQLQTLSVKNIH